MSQRSACGVERGIKRNISGENSREGSQGCTLERAVAWIDLQEFVLVVNLALAWWCLPWGAQAGFCWSSNTSKQHRLWFITPNSLLKSSQQPCRGGSCACQGMAMWWNFISMAGCERKGKIVLPRLHPATPRSSISTEHGDDCAFPQREFPRRHWSDKSCYQGSPRDSTGLWSDDKLLG